MYQLRRANVPVLPGGAGEIRILHISDLHLTPSKKREIAWLKLLASEKPDFVISTGDHLAHPEAVAVALDALAPLLEIPGAFVFGSNDYFGPRLKNPLRYLFGDEDRRIHGTELPSEELALALSSHGWFDLNDATVTTRLNGLEIELRGTDDAHLNRDHYSFVAGPKRASLLIGVTHAPYERVLTAMANDGADLILAGHTHGGQIRLPWPGGSKALVTNCDLPTWRARGLTRVDDQPWLHVSAGMGTNPFTPFRLACPPEASLLTLM
ncbi:phosphodiesterase YaeI [mine drainage metagenome]|uniref:Phosphodiesterase YaeI n=1 Tax=mine drainage metagenome TaxID=410659 RepID=A0A1J5QB07_9ZZZZ